MKSTNRNLDCSIGKQSENNFRFNLWEKKAYRKDARGIHEKPFTMTIDSFMASVKENGFSRPYTQQNADLYRSDAMENHAIPYMAYAFYQFIWDEMKVPSQDEFINKYFELFVQGVRGGKYTFKAQYDSNPITFTREELVGRLSRSYCSYLREIQLMLTLGEYRQIDVEYDFRDDLFGGIDLAIWRKRDDRFFGIASYVDTARSNEWKQGAKNTSRHSYKDEMIDMKASLRRDSNSSVEVNGVKLYSKSFIDGVVRNRILAS